MDAAPIRLAMTSVLAALLVSFAPTFGNPIVKFVAPSQTKASGKVERVLSPKPVPSPKSVLLPKPVSAPKPVASPKPVLLPESYDVSTPGVTNQPQGLVKLVSKANESLPQEQTVQPKLDTGPTEVTAPVQATISQAQAAAKLINTRPKQNRFQPLSPPIATHITRPTKVPLSAFFKTKPDAPGSSSNQVVNQPRNSVDSEPLISISPSEPRIHLSSPQVPLRAQEPKLTKATSVSKPPVTNPSSEEVTATPETLVKTRIQHVARPRAIKESVIVQNVAPQNPPANAFTPTLVSVSKNVASRKVASSREKSAFDSQEAQFTLRPTALPVSKVVHASGIPTAIPETANSELVEKIVGRPSLIAFVSAQPVAFADDDDDTRQIPTSASSDEDDSYEDGQPAIDRVTVNVRPTEGELPPDHASAKFAKKGEVVQRMGASRHWMMYEFNWEASALATRPVYFEDVNLERYGYSHGPLLEPLYSAGDFFLRVPFIPYMRGANPPFRQVYTLGYGRPGSYFPYYLHRPPVSLRGAVQEAAWAVGLVFILP